jgi:hypothetical protein
MPQPSLAPLGITVNYFLCKAVIRIYQLYNRTFSLDTVNIDADLGFPCIFFVNASCAVFLYLLNYMLL